MNLFKPIDRHLAHFVLGTNSAPEAFQLITYLSAALRQGHSSITVGNKLIPSPSELKEEEETLSAEEENQLHKQLQKGVELLRVKNISAIVIENDRISFELYATLKTRFQELYLKHRETPPCLAVDPVRLKQQVDQLCQEGTITEEQCVAIVQGCLQSFTTISGGPGTGKTYTVGILIRLFTELVEKPCKIALTAPTGKAAANLQKSLERLRTPGEFSGMQALTLHSLLKLGRKGEAKPIDADLVIVDESSMIDIKRMVDLFGAIQRGSRLILLGDPFQLPPVEVGGLFAELVAENKYGVHLSKSLRTDLKSIIEMAQGALEGDLEKIPFHQEIGPFLEEALRFCTPPSNASPAELLSFFNRFRILSPVNKGRWGCEAINNHLFSKLPRINDKFIAPILITKNDRILNLNNGETGVLVCQTPGEYRAGDVAYFEGQGEVRAFPAVALPQHTWAFCLSVHKSQGSEFEQVLLLWPEGAEKFGRPGLYTGITRAKKQIDLVSSPETLKATLEKN